jgi:predicted transcriptional regulator
LPLLKAPPKQPKTVTIQARVEESIKTQLDSYAKFINSSTSYVITEALRLLFKRDEEFKRWSGQCTTNHNQEQIQGEALTKTA